jgi:hypothetical protein
MICPSCGKTYRWFDTICPECQIELVDEVPDDGPPPDPNAELVPVFRTGDEALMPLAKLALDGERIEYLVRESGSTKWSRGLMADPHDSTATIEILVNAADAARAHTLLDDLAQATSDGVVATPPPPERSTANAPHGAARPCHLQNAETSEPVGDLTDAQLQFLIDELEEDPDDPQSYYITAPTIDLLRTAGIDTDVAGLLERALGEREGVLVRWSQDE